MYICKINNKFLQANSNAKFEILAKKLFILVLCSPTKLLNATYIRLIVGLCPFVGTLICYRKAKLIRAKLDPDYAKNGLRA